MDFKTLTFTRRIGCAPDRLFMLMTDRQARETWGAPDDSTVMRIDAFDMRPGGREVSVCGPAEAPEFRVTSDFHVIDAPRLFICSETLDLGDGPASVSLITSEVAADGESSRLDVTLQVASLIGADLFEGYSAGWTGGLDNLQRLAEGTA